MRDGQPQQNQPANASPVDASAIAPLLELLEPLELLLALLPPLLLVLEPLLLEEVGAGVVVSSEHALSAAIDMPSTTTV